MPRRLIVSLALIVVPVLAAADDRIPPDIRAEVTQRVDQGLCVGIVVGVVDKEGTTFFSRGEVAAGGPDVGETTLFEIGSITKAFTATLLADMAERKLLSLDDPVRNYLPPGTRVPERGEREITLRDLATHRSGLPHLPDLDSADPENPFAGYDETRLFAFLSTYELPRDIASQYEYSNLGAGLLGVALAHRAGKTYEQLVVERISDPLGLPDTRMTLSAEATSRLARGHASGKPVANWEFEALASAGALRSTARDLLAFVAANAGLRTSPLRGAMATARRDRFDTGVEGLQVALGWHVWTKYERTLFWHNGGTGGYRSFCGFDPERGVGVVVLTNTAFDADDIGLHILEPRFELSRTPQAVAVAPGVLEAYDGYYELGPGTIFHITHEKGQLYAQLTGQDKLPLFPESETKFFYKAVDARITFVRETDGRADILILHQNGDHTARRKADYAPPVRKELAVPPEVLARYAGIYELAPGIRFDVKQEGQGLTVQLTNQPRFPVFAESETVFFYKIVEATLTFVTEGGKVTSVILDQGGQRQTARRVE